MPLSDDINTAASEPKKAKVDGVEVEKRSIDEMIAADRYAQQKAAAAGSRRLGGIRFGQFRSSGSTGAS
jgi:hypothetical protein